MSGNVHELYEYEKPVVKGYEKKKVGRANAHITSAETKEVNRKKTAQRARSTVRTYANANPHLNKFLTLTFALNITDLNFAYYELDKFIKRLKSRYKTISYISVVEFQKRGAIHFHILCDLPYVDLNELAKIWTNGYVKINKIDNIDNVGAYITKYMTKENVDERLANRKCYTMSKNLNKPIEYTKQQDIDEVMANLDNIKRKYTSTFKSEYYGTIKYTQIVCKKPSAPTNPFERFLQRFKSWVTLLPDSCPNPFV